MKRTRQRREKLLEGHIVAGQYVFGPNRKVGKIERLLTITDETYRINNPGQFVLEGVGLNLGGESMEIVVFERTGQELYEEMTDGRWRLATPLDISDYELSKAPVL